jgi:hypothetical protein
VRDVLVCRPASVPQEGGDRRCAETRYRVRSVLLHGQVCKVFTTPPAMIVRAVGVAAHGGDALSTEMMYGRLGKSPPQAPPVHRAGKLGVNFTLQFLPWVFLEYTLHGVSISTAPAFRG